MMNLLGKGLAVLTTALSVVFLVLALAVATNQIDWGWKEPRKDLDERVPSEIDKRLAAVAQTVQARDVARKRLAMAQKQRAGTEPVWVDNNLWYAARLKELFAADAPLPNGVVPVKMVKGEAALDPDQPGRPLLDGKLTYTDGANEKTEVAKSYLAYHKDVDQLQKDLVKLNEDIVDLVQAREKYNQALIGLEDMATGKQIKPGLHKLLEQEADFQRQLKRELETMRPLWLQKLVDAQTLLEQQVRLESRLRELKKSEAVRGD